METMSDWFTDAFKAKPLMAILRGFSRDRTLELAQAAWSLGIESVEIPIQTSAAVETLQAVVAAAQAHGHFVGAGTVTSIERVQQAADVGAAFTVAPGFDRDVARASRDAGLAHLTGAASASEIQAAQRFGATWVKAFPASVLGTGWFEAMRGPFPQVRFVATGGMNARNAAEYLDAGASVVAVGSALGDPAQLELLSGLGRQQQGEVQ